MKAIILLLILYLLSGCARTVSTDTNLLHLDITFSTAGPIDKSDSIFIVVLSSLPTILPFNQSPNINDYFIFPGKSFDVQFGDMPDRSINYYYSTYFKNWNQFFFINNLTIEQYQADNDFFDDTIVTNQDHFKYKQNEAFSSSLSYPSSSQIKFSIDLDRLGYADNSTVYFSIFSINKDGLNDSGFIQDYMQNDASHIIKLSQYQEEFGDLSQNIALDQGLDIISWHYKVY